jgi:hypothetical protein
MFYGDKVKTGKVRVKRSGITPRIKVQNTVYFRGVAESSKFKFQSGKLLNILYFKFQDFTVREMVEQSLDL